ncbi:hypothetical protein NEOLEDRAFT_1145361 [Neolentinus lepideus HHB14362 ss-1]|uniref:Uncharacterized protein n=1 Tax=Neolentinus lepideus HHB14362 ss-1 TaxID=1314782 RepID=A0A165V2J8_9AGAM|nr:hypothetical protein NEOLEDRAFT_1145361 [Neolentinus lepideus HHB14362 ss-1]
MDAPSAAPRLRVTRTPAAMPDNATPLYPQAGPSRLPAASFVDLTHDREKMDGNEDTQATPRIPTSSSLPPAHSTHNIDNPAARLRALLARVPNSFNNDTPLVPPQSSSDRESDFEPPESDSGAPSVARESLKELFSRVFQDSSDTPPKSRRRNSIDSSIIESTPRLPRSESKGKHKSGSFSDEEVDRLSKYQQQSENSAKSRSAATFDSLRAKLDRFRVTSRHPREDAPSDTSDAAGYSTEDTASLLRELHSPPAATSTPLHSMQMPSQMQLHSNLLEGDSEMQRALNNSDSYEGPAFPPSKGATPPRKPNSRLPYMKSPSQDGTMKKGDNLQAQESNRTPSRLRTVPPPTDLFTRALAVDREREWNRRHPKLPPSRPLSWAAGENGYSSSHSSPSPQSLSKSTTSLNQKSPSPVNNLSRRGSSASLLSSDGMPSHLRSRKESSASMRSVDARASVIGVRERRESTTNGKSADLENGWNKTRPRLSSANLRMLQSSSSSSRIRTQSIPARPDSAQSMHSVMSSQSSTSQIPSMPSTRPHRGPRRTSSITSSGAGSSIAPVEGEEEEEEEVKEVLHERERNWNSPHPKWELTNRSLSPVSPDQSVLSGSSPSPTHKRFSLNFRRRTESLGVLMRAKAEEKEEEPVPVKTPAKKPPLRSAASMSGLSPNGHSPKSPSSPNLHAKSGSQSPSYLGLDSKRASGSQIPRPKSPMPPPNSRAKSNPELSKAGERMTKLPAFKGAAAFQFPSKNLPPLPPLELDEDLQEESPHAPEVTSSENSAEAEEPSEAFRSGNGNGEASTKSSADGKRGHRRSLTEFTGAVGAIPPMIKVEAMHFPADRADEVFTSDEESVPATSTPTIRAGLLPDADVEGRRGESNGGAQHSQQESISFDAQPVTPPATPPASDEPLLSLMTPPRPSVFTPPRADTETPSPSKGIPELPGPPSSSEDDTGDARNYTPDGRWNGANDTNFSMMKTPRPPGAWAATPVPPRLPPGRTQSLSDVVQEDAEAEEGGTATPVALSRAATLPLQTPAPPGAWMNTPATRPKSILKVRFDVETSESDLSHAGNGGGIPAPQFKVEDSADSVDLRHRREPAESSDIPTDTEDLKSELGSLGVAARSPRKGPTIRVLDAFGREASQDEVVVKQEESYVNEGPSSGQRNRSTVRVVDAMGREIHESFENEDEKRKFEDDVLMTQVRAVARIRETIAELREGFSDAERSENNLAIRDNRAEELERISRSARDARDKILKSMQIVRSSDPDLRSRLGPLKESMRRSRLLPSAINEGRWRFPSPWTIVCFVLLQIVLTYIMYKVATLRARRIFLTTYYDPFYPDLYLHVLKSETLQHVVPTHASWSVFSIPDGIARGGWQGAISEMWGNMTIAVANFNRQTYEILGTNNQLWAWPPT